MKRSDKKPLGCGICPYKTNSACHLERHLRIHTGQKPYACNACSYKATDGGLLKRHMRIHSGEKPFICKICGHKTAQSCSLKDHMAVHTGKKRYACDLCPFQCSRIGRLRDHKLQHKIVSVKNEDLPEQPLQVVKNEPSDIPESSAASPQNCHYCGLHFSEASSLDSHLLLVHSKPSSDSVEPTAMDDDSTAVESLHRCRFCSTSTETIADLNSHLSQHILYRCLTCDMTFESSTELINHGPSHSEEFIFSCDKCDFKSKTRNELRGHERIHNNSQQLLCSDCDFASKSYSEFAQHLQTHTSTEMVQCNICLTKFCKTAELKEHMVVHYTRSRPKVTRKLTYVFPDGDSSSNSESFHCYYCSYKCPLEKQMAEHIEGVHINPSGSKQLESDHHGSGSRLEEEAHNENGLPSSHECETASSRNAFDVLRNQAQVISKRSDWNPVLKLPKLGCYHCLCHMHSIPKLGNLEHYYQTLSHFMIPRFRPDLPNCSHNNQSKCQLCNTHDSQKLPAVKDGDADSIKGSQSSLMVSNKQDFGPGGEMVLHERGRFNRLMACSQTVNDGDRSMHNDVPPKTDLESNVRGKEDGLGHDTLDQEPFCSEPRTSDLDKESLTRTIVENPVNAPINESSVQASKSEDEQITGADKQMLATLRQFLNESIPKANGQYEGDSDQSTLSANTTVQDILTIELSSDSYSSTPPY